MCRYNIKEDVHDILQNLSWFKLVSQNQNFKIAWAFWA